jgi:hypothetical protein
VHKYFIKRVLEVCPSTPNLVRYGEGARLPLAFFRLQIIVKYWNRLCGMANDRLLTKSLLENIGLALRQKPAWCMSLQAIWAPFGFVLQNDPQPFGTDFVGELNKRFIENFMESLITTTKIKLETYTTIRTGGFLMPPYLQGKNREISVAKFRTGSHWLENQRGRFTKPQTERENRLCKKCNLGVVEAEVHVVFVLCMKH